MIGRSEEGLSMNIPKTCTDPYCYPDGELDCFGCPYNGLNDDEEDDDQCGLA